MNVRDWFGRLPRFGRLAFHALVPLVVLLALGVGLIFFLFPAADIWFVWRVYRGFVDTVANATGLNAHLVMAGALLAFVPFYRGVTLILYHPFSSHKRWLGIGILLVLAIGYNLTLYAATKDASFGFKSGTASKYYAVTPTGVHFFDRPGVDPAYGIPLQPVTPENIRNLELLKKGEFVAVDPAAARFFNPITGKAELWYSKGDDGALTFYDKPGFDLNTGAPLQPVTPQIYGEWKKARDAAEKAKRAAAEAAEKAGLAALTEKARQDENTRKAFLVANERKIAADLDCRIEAEKRHAGTKTKVESSPPRPEYGVVGGGIQYAYVWATGQITNRAPWADGLYEKCVRDRTQAR